MENEENLQSRFARQREAMVHHQIAGKGIKHPDVLEAMERVPRERFVLPTDQAEAYADTPLPIGYGQTISQPYIVGLMTEALEPSGCEKILEIGTGSGYQTAILCLLCTMVYSVEKHPELHRRASALLQELGYDNAALKLGDGTKGWPEYAPYDGIIVTAGAPSVPEVLIEQLKLGGRMVIPVGDGCAQTLKKLIRTKDGHTTRNLCGCRFVPLVGEYGWSE
jgi:protein-L-isoaspartate(D-aspartate) O-methyltransferase